MAKGGKRILVLGAGFGGLLCAIRVARMRRDADVVLVDERARHLYTPWLYEVVSGSLHHATMKEKRSLRNAAALPIRTILKSHRLKNIRFVQKRVQDVDFSGRSVRFSDGKTLKFDTIVIALGSVPALMAIPGLEKHARVISSIDSTMDIRQALDEIIAMKKKACDIVIVGAGATGTESSAEIVNYFRHHPAKESVSVHLMDAAPRILSRFPLIVSCWTRRRLERLGVNVSTDTMLFSVDKTRITVGPRPVKAHEEAAESPFQTKTKLHYDLLVWAGGVKPNPVVEAFALPKDERGRIRVRETMQVEGHPGVYAIGDIVSYKDPKTGEFAPGAAWAAIAEAQVVAKNIARDRQKHYHLPRRYPVIVSVGGKYGVLSLFGIPLRGRMAFFIRRLVDLNYFRKILPLFTAIRHWFGSVKFISEND